MSFIRKYSARALVFGLLASCHQPTTESEPAEETAEERALGEFRKTGPGTVTTIVCEAGSARIVDRASGSTVECKGPRGSTTTTSITCENGKPKSVMRSDRLLIFCPEQLTLPTTAPVERETQP